MTQYDAALNYLNDAVDTWYDQPLVVERALFLKGLCQARMHRDVDARATLREYLEKYPDSERAAEARELLGRLSNG
jgi:TolA-binding protein